MERIKLIITLVHQLITACYPGLHAKITHLTIFSKNNKDYEMLIDYLNTLGTKQEANNGGGFELKKPIQIEGESIKFVRIRQPDIHRQKEGCADINFENKTYAEQRNTAIEKKLDIIVRKDYEMIELSTFEINAYAYIVSNY